MDHKNNFNLLRLFAACQVVFMHSYAHLKLPAPRWLFDAISQFPGVPVFFVISGFLVSGSCLRSSTGEFFFKRALRIYPGLIANILILEALMWLTGGVSITSRMTYLLFYLQVYFFTASDWIAGQFSNVRYVPAFFPGYPSGVLWTLTVELSFYLVLPVILAVARLSRALGVALICYEGAASYLLVRNADAAFYNNSSTLLSITIPSCFWVFAFGILARLYWTKIRRFFEGRIAIWVAGYAALAVLAAKIDPDRTYLEYRYTVTLLDVARIATMSGVVLSAAYSITWLTERLRLGGLDLSFGLYLYHMLGISTLLALGFRAQAVLWPAVYVAGIAMAWLSWTFVEKPAQRFKGRLAFSRASPTERTVDARQTKPMVAAAGDRKSGFVVASNGPGAAP
ncbi:acyltransferase [Bradyrhizobium sp. LA6.12]|uniref:acyltransferase family protein n=1 Tax=unclassified Bradyrhizobium TaxID=2631580 RepID=UPI00339324D4